MVRIYELTYEGLCLYVGRTTETLKRRLTCHTSVSNNTCSQYIPGDYRPYQIKQLEVCKAEEGIAREQYWYDTRMPLYNRYRPGSTKAYYIKTAKGAEVVRKAKEKYRLSGKQYATQAAYRAKKKVLTDTTCVSEQT